MRCHIDQGPIVIAGGGLAALMTAHFLRLRGIGNEILVVERAKAPGGLLRAVDGGEWGLFDQGMHTFTSSQLPELDAIVFGLLPEDDWVFLRDEKRDLSGVVFEGKLQKDSHHVDLRLLNAPLRDRAIADFVLNLNSTTPSDAPKNMEEYARRRFGAVVADEVVSPILEKLYGRRPAQIDPVVATLLPFDRVTLFDESVFRVLVESAPLRSRIACPDQRRLPLKFASGRYSVYPKAFGAYRLIDAVVGKLRASGVKILTETAIANLEVSAGSIATVTLRDSRGETSISPKDVYWTAGISTLAKSLGLESGDATFEAPMIPAIINLLIDHKPYLDDLYYFWNFDPAFRSFRVANFINYSPGAVRRGGYPIAIEFFLHPTDPMDHASLRALAISELKAVGAIDGNTQVLHSVGHAVPVGFPILSIENRRLLEATRREVQEKELRNLAVTGIQSEWGVVYQPDVLLHAWRTVCART